MKNVVVLCLVLLLVAGVAVNGSRAQALSATSIAFEQCSDGCKPLQPVLAQTEAELGGADRAAGAAAVEGGAEIGESRGMSPLGWAAFAFEIARYLLDRLIFQRGGSARPGTVIVAETVFDPIR